MSESRFLAIACPSCAAPAGARCRIPSGRHERSAHPARQRALYADQHQVRAAIAAYDWSRHIARTLARVIEQEEGPYELAEQA
jgi:hypothetical protein